MVSSRPPSAASFHLDAIFGLRMGSFSSLFGQQIRWRDIRLHV